MAQLVDIRILQREYLLAISRALTAELDLHDVLRIILQSAVELVSGRAGLIALRDAKTETLRVAAVYGIPVNLVDHFAPLLRDLPNELDSVEQEAELTRRLQKIGRDASMGLTQMVRLPMTSGERAVGVIYVFLTGSTYYLPQDVKMLLRSFAEQAAIAVRNARLYQQVNQEKQRLDAIIEQSADGVMILDQSLRITVFNQALSRMTAVSSPTAIGRHHDEIFQWRTLKTAMDCRRRWPTAGPCRGRLICMWKGICYGRIPNPKPVVMSLAWALPTRR